LTIGFIAIRVDGDRRPDINERYNLGGWPTTVFLTDRGDTLSGGTYFDALQMMTALQEVADAYRDRSDEISARSARLRAVAAPNPRHATSITIRIRPLPISDPFYSSGSMPSMADLDRRQNFHIPMRCRLRSPWAETETASLRQWPR
jgi:hypothetical protein